MRLQNYLLDIVSTVAARVEIAAQQFPIDTIVLRKIIIVSLLHSLQNEITLLRRRPKYSKSWGLSSAMDETKKLSAVIVKY